MDTNLIINNYLNDYSAYFQSIERKLFIDIVYRNISINKLKESYQKLYGINARQFNSIKAQIDGKIKAVKELKKLELQAKSIKLVGLNKDLTKYTKDKEKWLIKLTSTEKNSLYFVEVAKKYRYCKTKIHYIKRQVQNIIFKISKINEDSERNIVRICFGSKDLFKKQYELEKNNYSNHKQWKTEWNKSRSNQFLCLGSKDETFGNQTCQYDDNNNLRIKVATRFEKTYGKYIEIKNIEFNYGQAQIDKCKISYSEYTKSYNRQKYYKAMTHRFYKNEFGWYLFTTVEVDETAKINNSRVGAIGIDFNVNFA